MSFASIAITEVTMRRRADPCAAPARAEHARSTAPGRARASRRLRRVALLCGPAPPSAATAARSAKNICATADAGGLRRSRPTRLLLLATLAWLATTSCRAIDNGLGRTPP